jgi:pimeloyl-ACP methyl ester carboxylesterase
MANGRRNLFEDLRGVSRLAIDATTGVTDLVQEMHHTIASGPAVLGKPLAVPAELFIAPVYGSIRGITRLVGTGIELALAQAARLLEEHAPPAEQEAVLGALNGIFGDYLEATGNPLAIEMCVRRSGQPLVLERDALASALPDATSKVVIFVHGSSMTEHQWKRFGHDHSVALARDLGVTVLHLVYNSGRHISENGRSFSEVLERLVHAWPVPVEELSLVGHSMGGLVSRSACHAAEEASHAWLGKLRRLVCLGSPHHGALLERGGNLIGVFLGISRYSAPFTRLARIRSAGVTDLRFGNVLDEHWDGHDRFASHGDVRRKLSLPAGVDCFFMAGSLSSQPGGALRGDGLVSVDSALGRHRLPELTLAVPESNQWVAHDTGHLALLASQDVYATLRGWFSRAPSLP